MKHVGTLITFLMIFAISWTFAVEIDWKNTPMSAAYVETTNGVFSVCGFNSENLTLYRFKGVTIPRKYLPDISGDPMIFAKGEKPKQKQETHYTENGNIIVNWVEIFHPEWLYLYGDIPYEIKDVDPPLCVRRTKENEVAVGILLYSRFYAVTNIGEIANGKYIYEINGEEMNLLTAGRVVPVDTPEHRKEEIEKFTDELEKVLMEEKE